MDINDVILIFQNNTPQMFAIVKEIKPDIKKDWWIITLQPLLIENSEGKLVPTISWILRTSYLLGADFTMNGIPMFLRVVNTTKEENQIKEEDLTAPKVEGNVVFYNFNRKSKVMDDEMA